MPLRELADPIICPRLLRLFGCETLIYDPSSLPLPDQVAGDDHPAVH